MKIHRIFFKIMPYLFRNHLFIFRTEKKLYLDTLDKEYQIGFPFDINNLANDQLSDVMIDCKDLYTRKKQGDLIGVIIWQSRIVHRSLLQIKGTAKMEGDPHAFTLAADENYIHYCYTAYGHRGKGLYPAMLRHIVSETAKKTHHSKIFTACRKKNISSIRAIQKAGFQYFKSSFVLGFLEGRLRLRFWYVDTNVECD